MYETLQPRIDGYRKSIAEFRELYEQDGDVTPDEQQHLDALEAKIQRVLTTISQQCPANGANATTMNESSAQTASSANMRVVSGAGGYEYEQHADGAIFIVKSPINGTARTEVKKGTTAYNAILTEIGPFPSAGGPGPSLPAPPEAPGGQPVEPAPIDREPPKAPGGNAAWDVEKAVQHLKANAEPAPIGKCGTYTREAVEAGGVTLTRHELAKDYGSSLLEVGFQAVNTANYQAGDVVVMQNCRGHDAGHMQMYSGSQWISDYVQRDFWPYTSSRPAYAVYRFPLSGGDGRR